MASEEKDETPSVADGVIRHGDQVVLDINFKEKLVIAQVTKNSKVKLHKKYCSLMPVLGHTYGSIFELAPDGLTLSLATQESFDLLAGGSTAVSTEKNNANLNDDGNAQKLDKDAIENLKSEGATGGAIIDTLVANSATFASKTEFSQEKYKKRKQKKYCVLVMICRPSIRLISECYMKKSPNRICGLRVDSLGMMLNVTNTAAHSRVLVFEESSGLVLASVLERLGGYGSVCSLSIKGKPSMDVIRFFNFEESITTCAKYASISELSQDPCDEDIEKGAQVVNGGSVHEAEGPPTKKAKIEEDNSSGARKEAEQESQKRRIFFPKKASDVDIKNFSSAGFNSLIIVAPTFTPTSILETLLKFMVPSGSFAIYSPWLQPLVECRLTIQKKKLGIAMQVAEIFWREHQVLPGRSHPQMAMVTGPTSGYVLSGIATEEVSKLKEQAAATETLVV